MTSTHCSWRKPPPPPPPQPPPQPPLLAVVVSSLSEVSCDSDVVGLVACTPPTFKTLTFFYTRFNNKKENLTKVTDPRSVPTENASEKTDNHPESGDRERIKT